MNQYNARYVDLKGTHYEIGNKLGRWAAEIPAQKEFFQTFGVNRMNSRDDLFAQELLEKWCPGMNEEICGFADALGIPPLQASYYAMTCLEPRCSQLVLSPGLTKNRHLLLGRNYEFSPMFEDFILARTSVQGKYAHIGTTVSQLGRDEGLNECGLAVSMTSCGFPVGALKKMRKPALRGLQFWAVIRTLLENCQDVVEALAFLDGMPIASNMNLMLVDKTGHAALAETLDGRMAVKQIDLNDGQQYLHATNHALLSEIKPFEPLAMRHSIQRYETIRRYLDYAKDITIEDLKAFLLREYPDGVCCHYYEDFFGTTKSVIMDIDDGKIDLCWGGNMQNGWRSFFVNQPVDESTHPVVMVNKQAEPGLYDFIAD